jgi:hypothetical protein
MFEAVLIPINLASALIGATDKIIVVNPGSGIVDFYESLRPCIDNFLCMKCKPYAAKSVAEKNVATS